MLNLTWDYFDTAQYTSFEIEVCADSALESESGEEFSGDEGTALHRDLLQETAVLDQGQQCPVANARHIAQVHSPQERTLPKDFLQTPFGIDLSAVLYLPKNLTVSTGNNTELTANLRRPESDFVGSG